MLSSWSRWRRSLPRRSTSWWGAKAARDRSKHALISKQQGSRTWGGGYLAWLQHGFPVHHRTTPRRLGLEAALPKLQLQRAGQYKRNKTIAPTSHSRLHFYYHYCHRIRFPNSMFPCQHSPTYSCIWLVLIKWIKSFIYQLYVSLPI